MVGGRERKREGGRKRERERERERERKRERKRKRQKERERVRERERGKERKSKREKQRKREREREGKTVEGIKTWNFRLDQTTGEGLVFCGFSCLEVPCKAKRILKLFLCLSHNVGMWDFARTPHLAIDHEKEEAQWPIGYGVGLRIKPSSVRIRPWPLRWVLGQGSLLPLSQGEAFTLASISYLAIHILAKKKEKKKPRMHKAMWHHPNIDFSKWKFENTTKIGS